MQPPRDDATRAERQLIARLRTPLAVQRWLDSLPYNWERGGATLRTLRGVVRHRRAHCLEAALSAATILERHGYPPLLLDLESEDGLDHVVFLFQQDGRWGSVGRSREPGLHGRKPVFRTVRELARSYAAPFIDHTGRLNGYGAFDLRDAPRTNWRLSPRNVWWVERWLIDGPHKRLPTPEREYQRWHGAFLALKAKDPRAKPTWFPGAQHWLR